jgi:hypothetical protein
MRKPSASEVDTEDDERNIGVLNSCYFVSCRVKTRRIMCRVLLYIFIYFHIVSCLKLIYLYCAYRAVFNRIVSNCVVYNQIIFIQYNMTLIMINMS